MSKLGRSATSGGLHACAVLLASQRGRANYPHDVVIRGSHLDPGGKDEQIRDRAPIAAFICASLAMAAGASVFAESHQPWNSETSEARGRQLPQYTPSGDLVLPRDWRSWVFVGDPLTPNALNGGTPISRSFITFTSSQARTTSTRRRACSPRARCSSKNCSLQSKPRMQTAQDLSHPERVFPRRVQWRGRHRKGHETLRSD
jgi:hypothetical protein